MLESYEGSEWDLIDDRYCIKEEQFEHVKEDKNYFYFYRIWVFHYSDDTTETLTTKEKFKK